MDKFNIRALTLAREVRGLSQSELAEQVKGLHQGHLSKVEKGLIPVSEFLAEKLATALQFPLQFFYQNVNRSNSVIDFFYRKRVALSAKVKTKIEAEVSLIRYVYDRLLDSVDIPETRIPTVALGSKVTPEDAAAEARDFFQIPQGPIHNLVSVLEKHGIAVIFIDVDTDKFDGLTVYTDRNYPIIVVNSRISNDRKKHTICHELGHQVCHLPFRFDFTLYDRIKEDEKSLDKEADQFAAAFLMPEKEIRQNLYNLTYSKLSPLKVYWQVSKKSIVYRAHYLECISKEKYTNLLIELSRHGERVVENINVQLDEPRILKQVYNYFKNELKYSNDDITKYLNVNERDWFSILNNSSRMGMSIQHKRTIELP